MFRSPDLSQKAVSAVLLMFSVVLLIFSVVPVDLQSHNACTVDDDMPSPTSGHLRVNPRKHPQHPVRVHSLFSAQNC